MNEFTNYRFIKHENEVIAISTFAGRTVKGKAKCHPNDTFDFEFGSRLAAARCNMKIAFLRYKRACKKYEDAKAARLRIQREFNDCCDYLTNSCERLKKAYFEVEELEGNDS